jgi:hypothetical protein
MRPLQPKRTQTRKRAEWSSVIKGKITGKTTTFQQNHTTHPRAQDLGGVAKAYTRCYSYPFTSTSTYLELSSSGSRRVASTSKRGSHWSPPPSEPSPLRINGSSIVWHILGQHCYILSFSLGIIRLGLEHFSRAEPSCLDGCPGPLRSDNQTTNRTSEGPVLWHGDAASFTDPLNRRNVVTLTHTKNTTSFHFEMSTPLNLSWMFTRIVWGWDSLCRYPHNARTKALHEKRRMT